ncbi:MAG: hypothetical protein AAF557_07810 [Pseudomonadota bacterium]
MVVAVEGIKDRESLREWLPDRPIEDARLIAFRAALRSLPLIVLAAPARKFGDAILLPTFRAHTAARFAGTWSNRAAEVRDVAYAAAANAADAARVTAADAADAAAYAARAAYADAAIAAAYAADAAAYAAQATDAVVYSAVCEDARRLEEGMAQISLAMSPLWPGNQRPDWFEEEWQILSQTMRELGDGWEVWIQRYQDIIDGKPADEETQLQIALIPEETWQQGAKVVNAEVARILAQGRSRPLAEADFKYNAQTNAMEMVPFDEDLSILSDEALQARLATLLKDLRDACMELARDIQLDKKQVPGSFRRDLNRYAREADRGPMDTRPGTLRRLGASLVRGAQDDDIREPLTDYLCPKLDEIVQQHLALQAKYHAGMFARMAPAENTVLDVTPEEADTRIGSAIETITGEAWQDLPRVPDELPEIVEQQREALRDMTARINLKEEGEERQRMIRAVEEGYFSLTATVSWFAVRTLEIVRKKATFTNIGSVASIIALLLTIYSMTTG